MGTKTKRLAILDSFEAKLDDKHRLTIPAKLHREFEGGKVILTPGFRNYLHLYTEKVWNEKMEPALKGDILDERIADLNVQFRVGKTAVELDAKQGRVTIPPHLIEHAGIQGGSVTAVRAGDYWRIMTKPGD